MREHQRSNVSKAAGRPPAARPLAKGVRAATSRPLRPSASRVTQSAVSSIPSASSCHGEQATRGLQLRAELAQTTARMWRRGAPVGLPLERASRGRGSRSGHSLGSSELGNSFATREICPAVEPARPPRRLPPLQGTTLPAPTQRSRDEGAIRPRWHEIDASRARLGPCGTVAQ